MEKMEGDVNLDSFGSGPGLLDLSLQADDEIAETEENDSEETVHVEQEDVQNEQEEKEKVDESYPTVENVVPKEQEDEKTSEKEN